MKSYFFISAPRTLLMFGLCILCMPLLYCNKLVEIDPPTNTIVAEQVFRDDANANSAINGLYSLLMAKENSLAFGNSWMTIILGLSADELVLSRTDPGLNEFYRNQVRPQNGYLPGVWNQAYNIIFQANSCIEGINDSKYITSQSKKQFIAEAKFIRAFCYYYLLNLFGDVPLVESTDWKVNSNLPRSKASDVLSKILKDLLESEEGAVASFSKFNGERVRVTKWAIYSFLSKIYLMNGSWNLAKQYADKVIENIDEFELLVDLDNVYLKDSKEAILQLYNNANFYPYNSLPEGFFIIPRGNDAEPTIHLSSSLLAKFDSSDLRRDKWIGKTTYLGKEYYYPYKYKKGPSESIPGEQATEYYCLFRLAEIILNRAEAKYQLGDFAGACLDINLIRKRAGLGNVSSNDKEVVKDLILTERQIEMFAEGGSRWIDMKRIGVIDKVMTEESPQKGGQWSSYKAILPINSQELASNPSSKQNNGY